MDIIIAAAYLNIAIGIGCRLTITFSIISCYCVMGSSVSIYSMLPIVVDLAIVYLVIVTPQLYANARIIVNLTIADRSIIGENIHAYIVILAC